MICLESLTRGWTGDRHLAFLETSPGSAVRVKSLMMQVSRSRSAGADAIVASVREIMSVLFGVVMVVASFRSSMMESSELM